MLSAQTALSPVRNARNSATSNCPHNPLDSCNKNLPEKCIHRKYASRPGGRPRRVFCCADACAAARRGFVVFAEKTGKYRKPQPCSFSEWPKRESVRAAARGTRSGDAPACEDGDANCRLQKRGGHCFAPVLYNENTNSDVWRRKRRGRSPDRAKRDPGISQAAMMRTRRIPSEGNGKLSQCRTRMSLRSIRATRLLKPLRNRAIAWSTYGAGHATAQHGPSESPQPRPSPRHALKRLLPLANSAARGEWPALSEYII